MGEPNYGNNIHKSEARQITTHVGLDVSHNYRRRVQAITVDLLLHTNEHHTQPAVSQFRGRISIVSPIRMNIF